MRYGELCGKKTPHMSNIVTPPAKNDATKSRLTKEEIQMLKQRGLPL